MSIIRPLSNPEGLYIFENINGNISFHDLEKDVEYDAKKFKEFIKEFDKNFWEDLEWEHLSIKEEDRNCESKMILKIYDVEFEMWYVTWSHIVNNILRKK